MNRIQFQITAEAGDETLVEQVCGSAAKHFGLVDTKITCRVEKMICNYSEGLGFGFGLGSCRVGDSIIVEFNPREGLTDRFKSVLEFIKSRLEVLFDERISVATPDTYVHVQSTLPLFPEGREFINKMLESRRAKLPVSRRSGGGSR